MRFGALTLPAGAGLAPMAGVTDAALRLLAAEQGAAWSVSEMLSAKGWVYSGGRNRAAAELLTRLSGEGIGGLQLFGREPDMIAEAARRLEDLGFRFLDLNFGCPAPKITGNGEGSAMMREPERIAEVVAAAVGAVSLPVTVKIRAGWDAESVNAPEVARLCEQAGACAVAVHARTREQQYAGRADWSVIRRVKEAVRVPVIGNGDVRSGQDALDMLRLTGCDAVMVGRGAQGNPWIFAEILAAIEGRPWQPPSVGERFSTALRHLDLEIGLHGETRGLLEMRKHLAWYAAGLPDAARFRVQINGLSGVDAVRDAVKRFAEHCEEALKE